MFNDNNKNDIIFTEAKSIKSDRKRSKREEDCKGLCSNKGVTIPFSMDYRSVTEKTLLSMRCSEHCGNTVSHK